MRTRSITAFVAAVSLALVACGGGDGGGSLSEDDFVDELADICGDVSKDLDRIEFPADEDYEAFAKDVLEVYQDALTKGLPKVSTSRQSAAQAERAGKAPSVKDSARTAARLRRKARTGASSAMVEAKPAAPAAAERAVVPKVGRKRPPAQAKPSA